MTTCDVGQFSHGRLVRGPQPLIDCLPETCGRRGPERGETCDRAISLHYNAGALRLSTQALRWGEHY